MNEERKIVGYKFTPVYADEFNGMQPASSSSCPISRVLLYGSGARNDILHRTVVEMIREDKLFRDMARLRWLEIRNAEVA